MTDIKSALGLEFTAADFSENSTIKYTASGNQNSTSTLSLTFNNYFEGDMLALYVPVTAKEVAMGNLSVTGLDNMVISYATNSGKGFSTTASWSVNKAEITMVKITGNLTSEKVVTLSSTTYKNGWQMVAYKLYNMPEAGKWYRFKSGSGNGNYLCSTLSGTQMTQSATKDATTLFYYSDGKLKAATGGYVSDNGIAETGSDVTFVSSVMGTAGKVNIKSGTSTNNFLYGAYSGAAITMGSESSAKQYPGYNWIVEPAVYESRSTAANSYGTICLPYDFTAEGAQLFTINGKVYGSDGTTVTGIKFDEVESNTLTAGTPYLYRATADEQTFTTTGTTYTDPTTEKGFVGVYSRTELSTNQYFLYTDDNKFHPAGIKEGASETFVYVGAYKCYIPVLGNVNAATSARSNSVVFGIYGDSTTGISTLNTSVDLNKDGKFIQNGRMVIVNNGKKFNAAGQIVK